MDLAHVLVVLLFAQSWLTVCANSPAKQRLGFGSHREFSRRGITVGKLIGNCISTWIVKEGGFFFSKKKIAGLLVVGNVVIYYNIESPRMVPHGAEFRSP